MNIADVLSSRAKLEGIQWMLRTGAPRRALRRELSALLPAPETLGQCRLRYARFGPGHKLTAYYDAHTRVARGFSVRPVAATWSLDEDADQRHGAAELAELQAEAVRRGVAAPYLQLMADAPAWRMHIQVSPLDARIPQLVRLSDPQYASGVIANAHASQAATGDVPASRYAVTSIRYRPGKRHVLRYDPLEAAERGTIFAKLYYNEKGARVFRVSTRVAEWLSEHGEGVTAVRPLAYAAEDAVVLYPRVHGVPLSERLRRPNPEVARCLKRAGAALHALHQLPEADVGPLRTLDFAAEIREVERDIAHVPALLPSVGAEIRALLDRAQELDERLPVEPKTFTHRDFKCEHLLVTPSGLTLIDFDICALADPALDVGKFLADLQLWFATYDRKGLEQAQEQFLAGYALGVPELRLIRARLYEAVLLVKMSILGARLFEHHAAHRTRRLIGRAQAVMNKLRLSLGLPGRLVDGKQFVTISV
jgi:aminoglycoside phosphotransferase (APT) family kinase protein